MKVELAPRYRGWMLALFPATLGLGTVALWFRSRNWPLVIDETGVRLRSHRYVDWNSVTKISVLRNYLDGHISHIRVHHAGGVAKVPVSVLENGQSVVNTMIFMFKRMNGGKDSFEESIDGIFPSQPAGHDPPPRDLPPTISNHGARSAFESSPWDILHNGTGGGRLAARIGIETAE